MSAHSGINKIISAAALLFTLVACTSTVQPHSRQRPASADPVPASSAVSAPPSPAVNVAVTGLALDAHRVTSGKRVTITGPVAARRVSGRFTAAAPAGDRFFALTTPFTSASTAGHASYVQGEIVPGANGSWSVTVSIGADGQYPTYPDRVTIVLANPAVAATLAKYEGRPGTLRPCPAVPWRTLATVTVTRESSSVSGTPVVSLPPAVGVVGLVVDRHPMASGHYLTITGPLAARRVSGRFTAAAPAGDRFFALTTPLSSAASYVQGEIVPAADGSWSVRVSIGAAGSYPAHPDRVTIVLASPAVAATLASHEGRPGTLRPVPALPWRTLATVTVTRKPSSPVSGPSPSASQSPVVSVAGLVVDGHPVTSGQRVTITGPVAARRVSGRFTAAAPAGDRFFALTTPLSSAASYVQGEIVPRAGGSWSVMVSIGATGSYPAHPDRVTIVLASPSVAATLAEHEGRPGTLRPVPALPWRTLATVTVTRKPSSPVSGPSASASQSPVVSVAGLVVDGHRVTSGQRVTITGPVAARRVSGRFTAAAPAGDRFFALTTPFTSASTAGHASYVQGEIVPAANGSWSVTVSIGADGQYPTYPDRVTIVLASPSVAATLASYEGQPGTLRPVPALAWKTLATVTITREPPSAPN